MTGLNRQRQYDQLLGSIKALENLEARIFELNRQKTTIMRQAHYCGLSRVALRAIIRLRRDNKCPDSMVISIYEGL